MASVPSDFNTIGRAFATLKPCYAPLSRDRSRNSRMPLLMPSTVRLAQMTKRLCYRRIWCRLLV